LASTFAQRSPGEHAGFEYGRSGNPTRNALEACVAALEGAAHGFAFASGLGASSTILSLLRTGDHIICGDDVYGGTFRLMDKVMGPLGISTTRVDMSAPENVRAALTPKTRMVWLETPTNPMLKIFDIAAVASIAKEAGALVVVDNTFATPVLQQGGVVVTNDANYAERLRFQQNALGAVPSPFDCYMVLRGLKTLHLRVSRSCATARVIAERLAAERSVVAVHYPGLPSHPGHALAKRQMKDFGAMITLVLSGGLPRARAFLSSLEIFACAESLGGVESLAEHPAIMTHASVPAEHRAALGIDDGLVRLSVGVEALDDLWADLRRALDAPPVS
jgi:cystathionine gamma-synthase/cystathionine gamma-lyase